jgi:hypothetical protein
VTAVFLVAHQIGGNVISPARDGTILKLHPAVNASA